MKIKVYKSKVDWWVYAVLVIMVAGCIIGAAMEGEIFIGTLLAVLMAALWSLGFFGVKYEINGNKLGIRNLFRWSWIPIDEIKEIRKTRGIIATASMSIERVSIKLIDNNSLKTSMPIDISPKDENEFILHLKSINPTITIENNDKF